MVAEHVVERTLNVLILLVSALSQLMQLKLIRLLILLIHVFGVVCACCPLISVGILRSICQAICRLWCHLHFSAGRVPSLALIHRVRAQTLDLASRSTIQTLTSLQDLIDLHLVCDFNMFKVRQLQSTVLVQIGAHLCWCFQPLLDQLAY